MISQVWLDRFALIPGYDPVATAEGCWFDAEAADRACAFFPAMLTHIEGALAGQPFELEEWQKAVVGCVFGWKREDGLRRYREVFQYVPRKNGKSTQCGGIINLLGFCDDEPGAQLYSAAAEREQAALVFRQAKGMIANNPELAAVSKIYNSMKSIEFPSNGVYKALSADADCLHPDTLVLRANGRRARAKDVAAGERVVSWRDGELVASRVASVLYQPPEPVYRIVTHRGRSITVTGRHPFLRMTVGRRRQDLTHEYEWLQAEHLSVGDRIQVALGHPEVDWEGELSSLEAWALGAWAGDGECGRFRFIGIDAQVNEKMRAFMASIGSELKSYHSTRQHQGGKTGHQEPGEHAVMGNGRRRKSPGREWVRRHFGQESRSATKDIPDAVWTSGPGAAAAFLAGWLDTDGCIPNRKGRDYPLNVFWASVSDDMRRSGQDLLARLGINASVAGHRLTVAGGKQVRRLAELLLPFMVNDAKREALQKAAITKRKKGFNAHQSDRIVRIDVLDAESTVSLEVDCDTHITNGIITHNTKHGFNTSGCVVDELHAHRNRDLVDVLATSTGSRRQPLIWIITTADFNRESICNEKHDYACKVRDGVIKDKSFLPVVYEAGVDDDWTDPAIWRKANPNLGVSVSEEYLARECKRAQDQPSYENTFKRLHLNIRTQQDKRWMQMDAWDKCKGMINRATLKGRQCFGGLDLASTRDITALTLVFPDPESGIYDVLCWFWVPAETIRMRSEQTQYASWATAGHITETEGNVTDYGFVRKTINELSHEFQIQSLAYDPWNAQHLVTELYEHDGLPMVEFRQGFSAMNEPTKLLESLIMKGDIRHGGNPVLRWMASNVAVKEDPNGNIRPDKKKSTEKIDGIVSTIMALALAKHAEVNPKKPSRYESRGIVTL